MGEMKWHTAKRKINELVPYDKNPRKLTEEQYKHLEASLKKFNLVEIPAINTDNIIIAGHQRLHILKALGRGEEEIDVRVPNRALSEAELREYNVRSNKNTGEWDWDILANAFEMDELIDWGFDEKDLRINMPDEEIVEDEAPKVEEGEPDSKLGEVYELGRHRLMCGDATKKEEVEKLMNGAKADMVFTDPPYNVNYKGVPNGKQWDKIANDALSAEEFEAFLSDVFSNISSVSKDGAALYICHADKGHAHFRAAFEKAGYKWRATIIWVKNSPAFNFAQYKYKHEPIFYCYKKGQTVGWYGDRKQHTVWELNKERSDHPTVKPVSLVAKAINNSSKKGGTVLDLFGGSGSTLIAAEQTGRTCYMMEIDPKYCDVIRKRYENYKKNESK